MVPAASPAFSLIAVLWCLFTIYAVLVESGNEPTVQRSSPPSPPPPPPTPLPSPPPPPAPFSPPPPSPIGSPPQPPKRRRSPPPPKRRRSPTPPACHRRHQSRPRAPLPTRKHEMNRGKKVGLFFIGISAILQIVVVGFLVYKRRQLLRVKDRFQTCS